MKVYLNPPQPSRGLDRIAHALQRYAPPSVEVCQFPRNVDLTVIYAIGRRDAIQKQVEEILSRGKQYAIVQVCLRSTLSPFTKDWFSLWREARVVWSYYDLQRAINIDVTHGRPYLKLTNFLHAPLGADSSIFYPQRPNSTPNYAILSSGLSRLSESVRECHLAAQVVGMQSAHLGSQLRMEGVHSYNNIDEPTLRWLYNDCHFVSGLRRTEGFELPAAEGLLCGARPIVFDTPDYRWNYREFAEYIHEGSRAEVVDQLVELFNAGARPVGQAELSEARHWFNWERVVGEFWQRCL